MKLPKLINQAPTVVIRQATQIIVDGKGDLFRIYVSNMI